MECMGPASNPLGMVSLVGDRTHSLDTFVCVEKWGYERSRERWLASSQTYSSPWTSPGDHRPCSPWNAQLFDDSQDIQKVQQEWLVVHRSAWFTPNPRRG